MRIQDIDIEVIKELLITCSSLTEVLIKLGFTATNFYSREKLKEYILKNNLDTSAMKEILSVNSF